MIIARSPLRISLGGGATDLKSYYSQFGGFCISAAINKYVYVSIHNTTSDEALIRYSQIERVKNLNDIQHPIIREALKLVGITETNIEITSMADIPAGTGLGSSGSFTTALLKALHKFKRKFISTEELAEMASYIEINLLKEPIGKQDQYASAVGGITAFEFQQDGKVKVKSLQLSNETIRRLEENLVMVSTNIYRAASKTLKEQDEKSKALDLEMINNLHYVKEMGYRSLETLESGDLKTLGQIFDEHWQHKKKRSSAMSNTNIDTWYELAMNNGAIGGKLIGAGGGGFLLFYTEEKSRLLSALNNIGLHDIQIRFDFEGTKIL